VGPSVGPHCPGLAHGASGGQRASLSTRQESRTPHIAICGQDERGDDSAARLLGDPATGRVGVGAGAIRAGANRAIGHDIDQADRIARQRLPVQGRARDATVGLTVTRLADASGTISFAGAPYRVGRRFARQPVEVSIVAGSVQLAKDGKLIRVHPIRHDRSKELGAFANPKGRPRRKTAV
jgi:hypothetical protein